MSDPCFDAIFDSPCRDTCSGWKQGFERGQASVIALLRSEEAGQFYINEDDELGVTPQEWATWLETKLAEKK